MMNTESLVIHNSSTVLPRRFVYVTGLTTEAQMPTPHLNQHLSPPARLRRTLVATANITSANSLVNLLSSFNSLFTTSLRIRRRSQRLRRKLLLNRLVITTLSELVDTGVVDLVGPSLVDVHEEDNVVAQCGETVEEGHLDGESEEVVDESVEELVGHGAAGHVGDRLESIVDVQTWDLGRGGLA
jgi:hypothetical protein